MDLDERELEETKKANGVDVRLVLSLKGVEQKINELEKWQEQKKGEDDNAQFDYISGQLSVLYALKKGDLSLI